MQTLKSKMNHTDDTATIADPFAYFWDPIKIHNVNRAIRMFNRRGRLKILKMIIDNPGITNSGIQKKTKHAFAQSEVSLAVRDLMIAGVVLSKRDGKQIHYFPNHSGIDTWQPIFESIIAITDWEQMPE